MLKKTKDKLVKEDLETDSVVSSIDLTIEEDLQLSELTTVGIGVYKNTETGEWMVAKLKFNPETEQAAVVEHIPAGPGRDFAIEKFKIVAVAEGIVG